MPNDKWMSVFLKDEALEEFVPPDAGCVALHNTCRVIVKESQALWSVLAIISSCLGEVTNLLFKWPLARILLSNVSVSYQSLCTIPVAFFICQVCNAAFASPKATFTPSFCQFD